MDSVRNPFAPGAGSRPLVLAGRATILQENDQRVAAAPSSLSRTRACCNLKVHESDGNGGKSFGGLVIRSPR